jgi:hypothetical protein
MAMISLDALNGAALAQNAPPPAPWPAAPSQGAAAAPWPSAPAQSAPAAAPWPSTPAPAAASSAFGPAGAGGWPQAAPMRPPGSADCNSFASISENAHKKAELVQNAMKSKADRKLICTLLTNFIAAEGQAVKFLEDNKTACNVPPQAITNSKTNHAKSMQFREEACSENGPHPKAPSLSDAIKTPTVDSAANTKTGRGTLDTLMGNPLSR